MSRQGRILVMDDLEDWREIVSESLELGGFIVDTAATVVEALEKLKTSLYHMLILDIRMVDEDSSNEEGMGLLAQLSEAYQVSAFEIIMLTAYSTSDRMREAFRNHGVSDFLDKESFDNDEFLTHVQNIFQSEIEINFDLSILWQSGADPHKLVRNLQIDGKRAKHDEALLCRLTLELDDLFCRLFHEAKSVLVEPLMSGMSDSIVLAAQPSYPSGAGQTLIVKLGDFREINQEYSNFKQYIQGFVGGGRSTTVYELRRTPMLGGIVYSLLDIDEEHLKDFGTFYRQSDAVQIKDVADRLFLDTCRSWYANPGQLEHHNLSADYQGLLNLTVEKLESAFNKLRRSVQGKNRLHFRALGNARKFVNPLPKVKDLSLIRSTYICTTHGDFNESNILIDDRNHTWLIDFLRTGPGHILRDVAQLDSVVRFKLVSEEEATLAERLKMEEALAQIQRFSDLESMETAFSTDNAALAKAYDTAIHLRKLAGRLVSSNPTDDLSEYQIALFYNALNVIRFYSAVSTVQREHALLSASLLAESLGL